MNPVVEAQLKQFTASNQTDGYQEQDYFEVYSIHAVHNGLMGESFDPFESHLTGSEFGLDGVSILVQGELCKNSDDVVSARGSNNKLDVDFVLSQAKRSEKFDYGEISKFLDGVVGFFDGSMSGESEQLDELMIAKDLIYEEVMPRNPSLHCYFISTGVYAGAGRLATLIKTAESKLDALDIFDSVTIELIGAKELQSSYRQLENSNSVTINAEKIDYLPDHESVTESYIGYVNASELVKLVAMDPEDTENSLINKAVFFDNIRDYNPDSEINASIISDLESGEGSSFVFKNNGITVVAKSITRQSSKFKIEQYQIVNGCQTSNALFHCKAHLEDVSVPIRLISCTDEDFVSTIIVSTNKQNEVKEEQFWALKPFMKNLEDYCGNQDEEQMILLERRDKQFRGMNIERTRVIKPSDLMKAVAAMYLYQPNRAARDFRGIRKEFESELFDPNHDVRPYHVACLATYRFDFMARNKRIDKSWKIYRYYILYVLGIRGCSNKTVFNLKKSTSNQACEKMLAVIMDEEAFVQLISKVAEIIEKLLDSKKLDTREQVRDMLRTETFAAEFKNAIKGFKLPRSKR